ncbi:MAG TPA: hypothetical protein VKB12_15100 [Pyrinomonadaceae bacterium]|nr:hypothetical protein [Pyrinomonadaceae bacterium]
MKKSVQTVEAVIDENGEIRLLEIVKLPEARRALAEDWSRPEEDEAWSHLRQTQ